MDQESRLALITIIPAGKKYLLCLYQYSRTVRYTYFSTTGQAEVEVELTSVEPQDAHGPAVHPSAARARHLDL